MKELVPPQDLRAESAALGAMLLSEDACHEALAILTPDAFYSTSHRHVFEAIASMVGRSVAIDSITLAAELEKRGGLEAIGGEPFLSQLVEDAPSASNVAQYCRQIINKSELRQVARISHDLYEACFSPAADAAEVVGRAQAGIYGLTAGKADTRPLACAEILPDVLAQLERCQLGQVPGFRTGHPQLDYITGGLQNGDFVILAARPSVGKTAFALSVALNTPHKDQPILCFSVEMTRQQIVGRLLSSISGQSMHTLRTRIDRQLYSSVLRHSGTVAGLPLSVDDTVTAPAEMLSRARNFQHKNGLGLVIIDHLQLVRLPGRHDNRQAEMSQISGQVKQMAKQLNVPILALSQLSRKSEDRAETEPRLSDLRETGSLEQDADVVALLHRPNPQVAEDETEEIQLAIAKQRNGPLGEIRYEYHKSTMTFKEMGR